MSRKYSQGKNKNNSKLLNNQSTQEGPRIVTEWDDTTETK